MSNDIIHLETLLDLIHKLDGVSRVAAELRASVESEMATARQRERLATSDPAVLDIRAASVAH
jgi:hypothetical protein